MKTFFQKYRLKMSIIIVILGFFYILWFVRQQNIYEKNPGLIPPRGDYDMLVDLTADQRANYEAELKKYDDLIKNFTPTTGQQEIDLGNGIKGMAETISKPEANWFIEKSRALENLGRYTEAIKTLNQVFDYYENSSVARNNLGVLYTNVGEYKYAIMNFQKLIEVFGDTNGTYSEKIVQLYLRLGDGEQAGQRYIKYEKNGGKRNQSLMDQIKELKESSK